LKQDTAHSELPCGFGDCTPFNMALQNGDLLLMEPPTQLWWQHAVPKRLRLQQERLNLTFRVVGPTAQR